MPVVKFAGVVVLDKGLSVYMTISRPVRPQMRMESPKPNRTDQDDASYQIERTLLARDLKRVRPIATCGQRGGVSGYAG